MARRQDDEWRRVWRSVTELVEGNEEDIVVIGGVAVYLHTAAEAVKGLLPEVTHDADLAISLPALSALSHDYEIVINRRLHKRQIILNDIDIDIYVARQSHLRLDYDQLSLEAVDMDRIRVVCLAHLLILKLDALRDRWASSHGDKDRRDVAKLLLLLADQQDRDQYELLVGLVREDDLQLLERVLSSTVFADLANKNAKLASQWKTRAERFVEDVTDETGYA